jgi:hypothetical protein
MDKGLFYSGIGHVGLIVWVVVGGFFIRHDDVQDATVTEVSLMSSAEFDALAALSPTAPAPAPEAVDVPADPVEETPPEIAGPVPPTPTPDVQPDVEEVAPEAVQPSFDEPTPGPIDLEQPPILAPVTSTRPRPKPAERVAPDAVEAPDPAVQPDAVATPAVTPEETAEPQVVEDSLPETAPEDAGTELATEANQAQTLAPSASSRPRSRPARRAETAVDTPADPPAETPAPTDATRDAIAEAVAAATAATSADTGPANAPQGPPMTAGEKDALRVAVQACWNVGSLSSDALRVTVTVAVDLGEDGKPDATSLRMTEYEGGSDASARQAFEAARRAVIRCGANGFNLPAEKYEEWRSLELVFNPERMRIK